jgi:hypothetical protein
MFPRLRSIFKPKKKPEAWLKVEVETSKGTWHTLLFHPLSLHDASMDAVEISGHVKIHVVMV